MQVLLALRGKFHYFPEIMSSYRFLRTGSWSQNMQKDKTAKVRDLKAAVSGFQLLDEYTQYKYSTEIYYRVAKHRCDLYVLEEIPFSEVRESFRHMQWGYMKLSRMRRCYDRFLRRHIPGIRQKY